MPQGTEPFLMWCSECHSPIQILRYLFTCIYKTGRGVQHAFIRRSSQTESIYLIDIINNLLIQSLIVNGLCGRALSCVFLNSNEKHLTLHGSQISSFEQHTSQECSFGGTLIIQKGSSLTWVKSGCAKYDDDRVSPRSGGLVESTDGVRKPVRKGK